MISLARQLAWRREIEEEQAGLAVLDRFGVESESFSFFRRATACSESNQRNHGWWGSSTDWNNVQRRRLRAVARSALRCVDCSGPIAGAKNSRAKRCFECNAAVERRRQRDCQRKRRAAARPPRRLVCADCPASIAHRRADAVRCEPCARAHYCRNWRQSPVYAEYLVKSKEHRRRRQQTRRAA